MQKFRHNKIFQTIYESNEIIKHDKYSEIVLRDKYGNITGYTKIDNEDVERVVMYKWHIKAGMHTNYATAHIDQEKKILLHKLILNYDGDDDIDHINHNGLDNRKNNLRIVKHSLNIMNQYNYDNGVKRVPSGNYQATIMVDGKAIYLGTFKTFEEAKEARENYQNKLFS